jgi:hypothetical protein
MSLKSDVVGESTSEADVQIDVIPVAGTGWYDVAQCIAHVVKSEV